jgi:hypothetical protein
VVCGLASGGTATTTSPALTEMLRDPFVFAPEPSLQSMCLDQFSISIR